MLELLEDPTIIETLGILMSMIGLFVVGVAYGYFLLPR